MTVDDDRAAWDEIAPGWGRWRGHLADGYAPVRAWLVERLGPPSGAALLELSAGAGDTGLAALAAAGPGSRLISTDVSPAMVELARRRAAELGVSGVEHRVMDAQRIDLPDGAVDGVLCQSGLMLVPDPAVALAEVRRVLRPQGRLAASVWGPAARNPWRTTVEDVLVALGHLPSPGRRDGAPGTFRLADARRLHALVTGAGLTVEHRDEIAVRFRFADAAELERWAIDLDGLGPVIGRLADAERRALRVRLAAALEPFATERGYELPGVAHAVCAAPAA